MVVVAAREPVARQAKAAATNYILIAEPLDRCDAFLRLRFVVRRKPTNLLPSR